jgi:hypothetical protein
MPRESIAADVTENCFSLATMTEHFGRPERFERHVAKFPEARLHERNPINRENPR